MANAARLKNSMDDIVFENRNKSYGAYLLRSIYDRNMTRGIIIAILLFTLLVTSPMILAGLKNLFPEPKDDFELKEVTLTEPPPIDPKKPPPPPPPKIDPPPIKDQIKFVPPKVMKDEEVKEEEPPPPTIDELKDKDIADETKKGDENGVDASLIEPEAPPPPPVIEEPEKEEAPMTFVSQMPEFPDGKEAMLKYIYGEFKYPAVARENGIEGNLVVQFVVGKDGNISKVKVVRGLGAGCDEEAIRVINKMPNWKAGKHNGKAVPVSITLPIKLTLQ